MPELPEVETVRRGLQPAFLGARITRVEQRRPNLRFPFPEKFSERLTGRQVIALRRRAKYILADIEGGEILLMHLGMSGRFWLAPTAEPSVGTQVKPGDFTHAHGNDPKHDHVAFETSAGWTVTYNDARRFGFMELIEPGVADRHPLLAHIGIEPLDGELTAAFLATAAEGKTADLKAFLMDQRIVAGLGNIYVCEALHRAGLSPLKPAGRQLHRKGGKPTEGAEKLAPAIIAILDAAILAGGSTLRDYKQADGASGDFQNRFRCYGRAGEACPTPGCIGTIARAVQSNRSTFHCPKCQR